MNTQEELDQELMDREFEIPTDIMAISRDDMRRVGFSHEEVCRLDDSDMQAIADLIGVSIAECVKDGLHCIGGRLIQDKSR